MLDSGAVVQYKGNKTPVEEFRGGGGQSYHGVLIPLYHMGGAKEQGMPSAPPPLMYPCLITSLAVPR